MNKIEKTTLKGKGVFASKLFKKEECVIKGLIEERLSINHSHASQIGINEFVLHNEEIRNVNHSCAPNCGINVNEAGAHDLIAIRDIMKGEEIVFDYAMRNYTVEHFLEECKCGTPQCRGKITGWKNLSAEKKREYKPWAAPYLLELERRSVF